jgi:uncharacterized membrane protein
MRRARQLVLSLGLGACAGTSDDDDGGADSADTGTPAWCEDAPVVTWNNFGQGFVTEHCQACHAGTAEDRNGAPADVTFDSHEETRAWSGRILARAAGEAASMPPRGGVSDDDKLLLEIWISCWEAE